MVSYQIIKLILIHISGKEKNKNKNWRRERVTCQLLKKNWRRERVQVAEGIREEWGGWLTWGKWGVKMQNCLFFPRTSDDATHKSTLFLWQRKSIFFFLDGWEQSNGPLFSLGEWVILLRLFFCKLVWTNFFFRKIFFLLNYELNSEISFGLKIISEFKCKHLLIPVTFWIRWHG